MEFRDIYEVAKASRPWFVTEPTDGKIPPMMPDAQRRIAARPRTGSSFSNGVYDSYENLSLYDRCITRGYPGSMLPAIYGDSYQIVQGQGWVGIRIEMIHETRVIPLDNRAARQQGDRARHGRSARPLGRQHAGGRDDEFQGPQHLPQRQSGKNAPRREVHPDVADHASNGRSRWTIPTTWTRPWTFSMPLTMNDEEPIYEYACHEGNYAMSNILNGSRAADKAAAAK